MPVLRRFAMLATLSHASAYVPGATPRASPAAASRTVACRVQMQLGEATRDVEETVFATRTLFDTHGMVMPTEISDIQLESGVAVLPHPAKAATGGEDASFTRDGCYAVFDGVGGWASKGVDSGAFSRALAAGSANALDMIRSSMPYNAASVFEDLEMSLDAGLADIELKGSTTACMLSISPDGRVGNFLNVGDSGFHIFRPSEDGARSMQLFAKSAIQQHEFNYPFQLSSWAANVAKRDMPSDGERYVHELLPGDIILLSSDGVLDNLFDEQISTILDGWGGASAADIAAVIAKRARECSLGDTEVTPWTVSLAAERGTTEVETRGKVDDVTVLAVKVLARARVEGYAPEPQEQPLSADTLGWGLPTDMAGGVVPTSSFAVAPEPMIVDAVVPSPPSAPMVHPMDAKAAWLAGRRGSLRWIA